MFLEMHLGTLLIERKFIDFGYCETITEREEHIQSMVEKMHARNILKVAQSREEPVFYLDHVPSKMFAPEINFIPGKPETNGTEVT